MRDFTVYKQFIFVQEKDVSIFCRGSILEEFLDVKAKKCVEAEAVMIAFILFTATHAGWLKSEARSII